jgi:DNA/RNA endonuclease G (NUC1)
LIPDSFWKVIIRNDEVIAWLIPNSTDATKGRLDEYLVSVHEIEEIADIVIPIDQAQKKTKLTQSWDTDYCNERSEKHWRGGWKS